MIRVGIMGATGYVGSELVRILLQHPKVELKLLASQNYIRRKYDSIYENFKKICEIKCVGNNLKSMAEEVDVIFLALPHGITSMIVTKSILKKVKIIDLSADFRLKNKEIYEKWYKTEHHNANLLNEAIYGLCELERENIKRSNLIANPGSYPTCVILSLFPLLGEDIIKENSIIVDAKSGITGAGRTLNLGSLFGECNESIRAYNITSHRHRPEIEQQLSGLNGNNITITFTPHLIPMNRGILTTCYGKLKNNFNYVEIKEIYENYYFYEYFIRLTKKGVFPETKFVKGSNYCDIGFTIEKRTGRIIIVGAIDNLIKGAAGQAVQNMNIMFNLDENMGLKSIPIFPT